MRSTFSLTFTIFVCFILLFNCNCREQSAKSTINNIESNKHATEISEINMPHPRIKFEERILNFGKIGPGTKPTGEFIFTNIGDASLEITTVSQCCGVVTELDKSKFEPGESGVIKASYTAASRAGNITRQPIVYSNDPIEPNLALTIKAEIVEKTFTKPTRLDLFIDEENAGCEKLTIKSLDDQPFSIRSIKSTGNCITAKIDPSVKASEFILDLKVNMEALQQNKNGSISFTITHPESNMINVPFDVVSKFTINPPLIIILDAEPQKPKVRKLWVFNNHSEDFEIESTSSKNNYFKVLSQSKIEDGYQFEVEITPPAITEDEDNFVDEFYVQVKDREKLTFPCRGYYK